MSTQQEQKKAPLRLPEWFKYSRGKLEASRSLSRRLQMEQVPNSICEEARCPNRSDCFERGVLTFMILGTTCTRNCGFCSVEHGKPMPPDSKEVNVILNSIEKLNLKFVVLTSPNRDDLKDGGSAHYKLIVSSIKRAFPAVKVEILIPDFKGNIDALKIVSDGNPDVINHNIETVPSLYRTVRKGSLFDRSISVLKNLKEIRPNKLTKSGVMVGLGETREELLDTFRVIRSAGVDILTVGQYLKPARENLDVIKYYSLEEFEDLKSEAEQMGFRYVFSGPKVRSSFLAEHVFDDIMMKDSLEL